jgi:hypothetical protein
MDVILDTNAESKIEKSLETECHSGCVIAQPRNPFRYAGQARSGIEIDAGGQDQQFGATAAGRPTQQKPIEHDATAGEPRAIDRRLFCAMMWGVDIHA